MVGRIYKPAPAGFKLSKAKLHLDEGGSSAELEIADGGNHHVFEGALGSSHRLSPEPAITPRSAREASLSRFICMISSIV